MAFHSPQTIRVDGLPIVLYAEMCVTDWLAKARSLLNQLSAEGRLTDGRDLDYGICFLWIDDGDLMVDVWRFWETSSWDSGPLADVSVFRGLHDDNHLGRASGNTLLVLGREEDLRRAHESLESYLCGPRPPVADMDAGDGSA